MRRRLFNAVCLLSLVLAVAVAALWARSVWWATDHVWYQESQDSIILGAGSHSGLVYVERSFVGVGAGSSLYGYEARQPADTVKWSLRLRWWPGDASVIVWLPHWLLVGLALLLPVGWLVRRELMTQSLRLQCPRCGYDLRGSSGGACPECGEATASTRSA